MTAASLITVSCLPNARVQRRAGWRAPCAPPCGAALGLRGARRVPPETVRCSSLLGRARSEPTCPPQFSQMPQHLEKRDCEACEDSDGEDPEEKKNYAPCAGQHEYEAAAKEARREHNV